MQELRSLQYVSKEIQKWLQLEIRIYM